MSSTSSNSKRNFYDILNATSNATTDELKSNYKQLILQYHPDKLLQQQQQQGEFENNSDKLETYDDPNNREFVAITEAWNCLKDPLKRKQYDAELLLNKFHTHNNIYAHIKLSEMKKQINTEATSAPSPASAAAADTDDEEKDEEVCNTSKYLYTYDCRCGGQYIVDESAEQYCRIEEGKNCVDDDDDGNDAGNHNNKSYPTNNTHTAAGSDGGGNGGGVIEGVIFNKDNSSAGADDNDDEEGDGELIVECSECSLVIILNG